MRTLAFKTFVIILSLAFLLTDCTNVTIPEPLLNNPYKNYVYWYKVQVHAHSDRSPSTDSNEPPQDVLKKYKDAGYQLIGLTDHDATCEEVFTDPEVPEIIYLPSEEVCWGLKEHLLAIGLTGNNPSPEGETSCDSICELDNLQQRIDWIVNAKSGIAVLAHPSVGSYTWDEEEVLTQLSNFHGLEIFNSNTGDAEDYVQTRLLWDRLLERGKSVWGFSGDDYEENNFNLGWIVVNSNLGPPSDYINDQATKQKKTALRQDIIENIRSGNFYSVVRTLGENPESPLCQSIANNNGPSLNILAFGGTITASTDVPSKFAFIVGPDVNDAVYIDGEPTMASYTFTGNETYVRAVITRTGSDCLDQYTIYSQPLIVKGKGFTPHEGTVPQGHACKDTEKCLCSLHSDGLCYSDCVPQDSTASCP